MQVLLGDAMSKIQFSFRAKNKGGPLAGKILEKEVPQFVWHDFINAPNAEQFARKAYYAAIKRIIPELAEDASTSSEHHLDSIENVIMRDLKFTQKEICDWCESRDRTRAKLKDRSKGIAALKESLPKIASGIIPHDEDVRKRFSEIVGELADNKLDPIAEYLFSQLTSNRRSNIDLDVLL
jgi:hypothetical protein